MAQATKPGVCATVPVRYVSHYIEYGGGRPTKNRLWNITCTFDEKELKQECRSQAGLPPKESFHTVHEFRSLKDFVDDARQLGVEKHIRFLDLVRGAVIDNKFDTRGRLSGASFWEGKGGAKVLSHDWMGRPLRIMISGQKCAGRVSSHRYTDPSLLIRDRLVNMSNCGYVSRRREFGTDADNQLLRDDFEYQNGRRIEIENTLRETREYCYQ
jgi:hypothetical protein